MEAHVTDPVGVSTMSEKGLHTWVHHVVLRPLGLHQRMGG